MIELKNINYKGISYIGIKIRLPKQSVYLLYTTHCILVSELFHISKFHQDIAVLQMHPLTSFEQIEEMKVIAMNDKANTLGYTMSMKGNEVLAHATTQKNKEEV